MKTLFIEQLAADTGKLIDFFQVAQCDRKTKKGGQGYLALKLRDRTGEVDAKLWDIPDGLQIQTGDFVKVDAETQTYREALQLKLTRIRKAEPAEVVLDDFIPASKRDRNEMLTQVDGLVASIANEQLRASLAELVMDFDIRGWLRDCPAAMKKHQAYLGGLLEHILNIASMVEGACKSYPVLNRDVLIAGAILHDIGKVFELCYQDHIGYTRIGTLTGHIIQGSIIWFKYSSNLDKATRDHIEHIIASHHGQKEWGAAVLPMTREAFVFHLLDQMDSQMGILDNLLAGDLDSEGFAPFDRALNCTVWNGQ